VGVSEFGTPAFSAPYRTESVTQLDRSGSAAADLVHKRRVWAGEKAPIRGRPASGQTCTRRCTITRTGFGQTPR